MSQPLAPSTNSADAALLGSTLPRLWTPPLVELTPETSYGYDVIDFARDVLDTPLDPWQEWAIVHAGELLPDGRPRFRTVLILVSRQNGKTLLNKIMILYWLFVEAVPLVLGTSTSRDTAKRSWREVVEMAQGNPWLSRHLGPKAVRLQIGEEALRTELGSEYSFAATNRRAGRGLTVHRLIIDEIREHDDWDSWNASHKAMTAVPQGQAFATSNMGDDRAVVLDALRDPALEYIETGKGDPRLGLFEWSAPPGCAPDDLDALAQANPNLGRRIDADSLLGDARRAARAGGEELAGFRTEVLCQRVYLLDPAIDPDHWARAATTTPIDLAEHRDRVACCLDVSLDGSHATLTAAAVVDGKVHLDVVAAWDSVAQLRRDLPSMINRVRPRVLSWFPNGPAASLAADLRTAKWPRGMRMEEISGDAAPACMGLAEQVMAGQVVHSGDPMQDHHIRSAQPLRRGDVWVFGRRGSGPIDGAYAAAGAVHMARTMPPPRPPLAAV